MTLQGDFRCFPLHVRSDGNRIQRWVRDHPYTGSNLAATGSRQQKPQAAVCISSSLRRFLSDQPVRSWIPACP